MLASGFTGHRHGPDGVAAEMAALEWEGDFGRALLEPTDTASVYLPGLSITMYSPGSRPVLRAQVRQLSGSGFFFVKPNSARRFPR